MKGLKQLVQNIKPSKSGWLLIVITLIFSLVTQSLLEVVHRGSFSSFLDWSLDSTFSFGITFLFLFFLSASLLFLPNYLFIPLLVFEFVFFIIVSFGSHTKFLLRGEYFTPFDLYLLNEGADISKLLEGVIGWKEIAWLTGIVIILFLFSYWFIRIKKSVSFKSRFLLSLISIICFSTIAFNPSIFSLRSYYGEVGTVESYEKFGLIGAYLSIAEKARKDAPEGYSKEAVNRIVNDLGSAGKNNEVDQNFQPNIIVVLAESFWDPLLLENITYKEDPIPYFRSLSKTSSSGVLLTHYYGGGTFNSELDVLTGLSNQILPEYYHQLNRPVDSLAHVLRNQGYNTTALHDFKNWFYSRNTAYEWLGFEKFVSMEFLNNPKNIGPFIDDQYLMQKALDELKQSQGPDFLNVVTVTSHGPYNDVRYEEMPTQTTNLDGLNWYILNLYTNLLKNFDDSMKTLIEGVKEIDEPTMVVVYGDHLPFLGEDYGVYRDAGYYQGKKNDYEEYKKMYETPLLVWDNFSDGQREDLRMTPNFLGSYILAHAKKEMSPIFKLNQNLYNQGVTVIPKKEFFNEEGVKESQLADFKMLQYDVLKGKQYGYQNQHVKPVDDYLLGSGKMKIDSIKVRKEQNNTFVLDIHGQNFVSNAKVYLDDKEIKTHFANEQLISIRIKEKSLKEVDVHQVRVKVLDDRETVIAETGSKKITIK